MTERKRLKRPTTVRMGAAVYDVSYDISAHENLERGMGGDNHVGRYAGASNRTLQLITVAPREDVHPDSMRETLLHEVLHQCLRMAGCDPDQDAKAGVDDTEERAVSAIAPALLAVLRDNPDLTAWILAPGKTGEAR